MLSSLAIVLAFAAVDALAFGWLLAQTEPLL
jgi:hypothetical protein